MPSARLAPALDSLAPKHRRPNTARRVSSPPASMPMAGASPIFPSMMPEIGPQGGPCRLDRPLGARCGLLHRVRNQFSLHHLAIEDAEHAHQRPKLEQYGEALFVVARTAQLEEGRVVFGETHVFIGKGYIVSVRHGASTSYAAVRQHWEACPSPLARGDDYILWAILDFIVDNYMPVLEAVHDEVEAIEDRSCANRCARAIERLYMLRRDLLRLRNAVGAAGRRLRTPRARRSADASAGHAADVPRRHGSYPYRAGGDRQFARGAGLRLRGEPARRPGQETAIAKRLASWAAILAVPTAIAGIYGMNFKNMPELEMAVRLLHRHSRNLRLVRHSLLALPQERLAVTDGRSAALRAAGSSLRGLSPGNWGRPSRLAAFF